MSTIFISLLIYKANLDEIIKSITMLVVNSQDNLLSFVITDNDNGKQLGELKAIIDKAFTSNFIYIASPNVGYGKGHNLAFDTIKSQDFDYFVCANPDGIFHPDCINNMVTFAKSVDNKGIFEAVQFPVEHPKYYCKDTFQTDWCSGCCIMFPKQIYQQLQGFSKDFFLYCEDVDISWRARALGYKCYTVGTAKFAHFVDTKNRDMTKQQIEMYKSGIILAKKYCSKLFEIYCRFRLRKLLPKAEIMQIGIDIKSLSGYDKIAVFKYLLHFSKVRW